MNWGKSIASWVWMVKMAEGAALFRPTRFLVRAYVVVVGGKDGLLRRFAPRNDDRNIAFFHQIRFRFQATNFRIGLRINDTSINGSRQILLPAFLGFGHVGHQ